MDKIPMEFDIKELSIDVDRIKKPTCPYCFDDTISFSLEHEDGGWLVGWTCDCTTVRMLEKKEMKTKVVSGPPRPEKQYDNVITERW